MDAHKRMFMIFALGIGCYGGWTGYLIIFSLIAESGGKDSNPWLALGVLWPLGELILSWIWIGRHPGQYATGRSRRLGDGLVIGALVVLPPITFLTIVLGGQPFWELGIAVPGMMMVITCWVARRLWSRSREPSSGSLLGL